MYDDLGLDDIETLGIVDDIGAEDYDIHSDDDDEIAHATTWIIRRYASLFNLTHFISFIYNHNTKPRTTFKFPFSKPSYNDNV